MVNFGRLAGLVAGLTIMGVSASFATPVQSAPAPEIGATSIGMMLAAGIALYIRKRGKQ